MDLGKPNMSQTKNRWVNPGKRVIKRGGFQEMIDRCGREISEGRGENNQDPLYTCMYKIINIINQ